MNKALITIKKGQFSAPKIRSLEQIVLQNYKTFISKDDLKIIWNLIPAGNTYKNRVIHQPTIISLSCDIGFSQDTRLMMFKKLSKDWLCITGQLSEDLIIAILENPTFESFINKNGQHITELGKLKYYSNMMLDLTLNKTFHGYYAFNSSLSK